jgi:hypothetical protein
MIREDSTMTGDYPAKIEALAAEFENGPPCLLHSDDVSARLRALLPQPLKIEPGNWCRTRDGRRAFVLAPYGQGFYVAVSDETGATWATTIYHADGQWSGSGPSRADIIAPWEDGQ